MKKITLLFAVLLSLAGATRAQKALPYSYGFEDYNLATDGWTTANPSGKNASEFAIVGAAKKSGSYGFRFSSYNTSGENTQYLISPELTVPTGVNLSFYYAASDSRGTETFKVGYSTTDTEVDSFTFGDGISTNSTSWTLYEESFPAGTKYIAVYYYANYQYRLYVDDFEFTAAASGPALSVADGTTKVASGYAYNFGLGTAGTTKEFTLSNPGTEEITVNITATNGFAVTPASATIAAKGEQALTVTMPDATATGTVTITPTAEGIDPFVINVSGTIRDASKVYEQGFTALPEDWTTSGSWYYSEANGAYTTAWYLSSGTRLITPQLTVAEGETFYVEAKGYSTSNTSYQHLQMQYSADGTTWTNFDEEPALDPSAWQTFSFTGAPAGKYYIAINASQADIRMFYGGELPTEPKFAVTASDYSFGVIDESTTSSEFTISNSGKATLTGVSVASSSEVFTVSSVPTSIAAGESATFTVTMSAATVGAQSGTITVSADGFDDVTFNVSGVVLPEGMSKEEFTDGLPAGWTNASWTFAGGEATGKSSSAYLTTPKLIFSEGDMVVIKAKRYDSDTTDYLTVQGSSDNGSTWTAYTKKLQAADGLTYPDYGTLVLTDIPTTVNRLRFVGYYVVVDEIAGLTYAPVLSVSQEGTEVTSPASYDFGETSADATVTYSFANTGAGTINVTNVAITGEGAAAYTTNWTASTAAPFDLTITRTYDASRTEAQEAVVTVTTSEGDFVINVTGTDKAANAPELAVSPAEDAAFGVVTEPTAKTYTVTNAGTGLLTVDIYSNDSKFTVAPAQLADIAAGESQTFTVTFTPEAGSYGVFTAEIVVIPTYDESAAVPFNASAKVKDPDLWSEDFAAGTLPTGWDAGSNWTFTDGVAKASYAYGSTNYLTTPTLTVSDASDELTFDYKATANYVSVKIQMSQDGAAFADYQTISGLNSGDEGTYTITGLEAGEYQFRFANDDYDLDNFEGFRLNLADHIAAITASDIPTSSSWNMTMKEGKSFDATVTVKEMRGVDEELTARLYMGEEVIGTATGSVAANGTETLTITATPTTAATEGIEMHIEVEYAGGTLTTEAVTRYVAALTYLVLDENSSDAIVAGTYDHVTLKRAFNAGWNSVCLPFTVSDVEAFFGEGAKAFEFTSYDKDGVLSFSATSTLTASYPYVIYLPEAISEDFSLTDITIATADREPFIFHKGSIYLRGTYAPVAAGGWDKSADTDAIYGVTAQGRIQRAGENASIKGFRAYFDVPAETEVKGLFFEDMEDGIRLAGALQEGDAVYNLAGQRVQKMQRGINIINGKKLLVK